MMRVLLIGPSTKEAITNTRWVTAPLGVHYISSFLNANGHHAEVYDINIDECSLKDTMLKCSWDIIAFSSQESCEEYDLSNIHLAKKVSPKSILVAGGTGSSLNYSLYFSKSPIDIIVQAEGEYPMLELCNMLEQKGWGNSPLHTIKGLIIRNRAEVLTPERYWNIRKCLDVSAMKAQSYWNKTAGLYDNPDFNEINTFRLYTANYCPMNCAFCTLTQLRKYSTGETVPVLSLTVDQIVFLIKKVLNEYKNCRQIFFVDDDFFINRKRGIDFCNEIIRLKQIGEIPDYLRFICLTNINRIDETNIDLIAKAGFKVLSIGVESLSQHVLDSLDKKQTVDKIWKNTELILSRGIKPYYTLLCFTSFCTFEDILIDVVGFKKLGQMGVGLSIEPYLIPLRGTRLSEEHVAERVRKVNIEGTNESIYKGFAWLPQDEEVKKIFNEFEIIYPKYRKRMLDLNKDKHSEKNWQAYVLLDALVLTIRKMYGDIVELEDYGLDNWQEILKELEEMKTYNVDVVGSVI